MEQRFTPQWVLGLAVVILFITWVGLLAHRHVEYTSDLWWTFGFNAPAPRMLRASLVVTAIAVGFVAMNLLSPGVPPAEETLATAEDRVKRALALSPSATGSLALLGDKRLLFHPTADAFVMYQVAGRSWISMGDPVGPPDQAAELAWAFRELCDRHGGWSVF